MTSVCNISVYCFPLVNRATTVVMLTFPVTRKEVPSHTGSLTFCLKNLIERSLKVLDGSMTRLSILIRSYWRRSTLVWLAYRVPCTGKTSVESQKLVQVIYVGKCHWVCISTIGCMKVVSVMDSLYPSLPQKQCSACCCHSEAQRCIIWPCVQVCQHAHGED